MSRPLPVRPAGPPVFALSVHATYRCRSSGVCCGAGWTIAVEPRQEDSLRAAIFSGALTVAHPLSDLLVPADGLPDGARVILGFSDSGRCRFHEPEGGNLCSVHRQIGPADLPLACRQFPRITLTTPRGIFLSLSHFCPTAAGMLFDDVPLAIVADPPGFPRGGEYVGLDASTAYPPFLRPGVITCWDSYAAFEEAAIAILDEPGAPEDALARIAGHAEALRRWIPSRGQLLPFARDVLAGAPASVPLFPRGFADVLALAEEVARCVPAELAVDPWPESLADADAQLVAPFWPAFAAPLRRYVAARLFASWTSLQGQGLRTTVRAAAAALAVVRVQAAALSREAGRPLDAALLKEAFRAADLLYVHHVRPELLAVRLGRRERP